MKSLLHAAADLQGFLLERQWRFCFIGGIALQRWGEARLTVDADVSLFTGVGKEEPYIDALCGQYQARVDDARGFARANRVLLIQSADGVPFDIALAGFPYEETVIERASDFQFLDDVTLRTCSAEDLIVLKAFADRSRDWADVEAVIARQQERLDREYITAHLAQLSALKQEPGILERLNALWDERA